MISNIIRHLTALTGWTGLLLVAAALGLWMIVEHYLSLVSALQIAGFEEQEMRRDPLLGRVLGAFIPEASLSQAVALTIAATEAVALLIICAMIARVVRLLRYRRECRDHGDDARAKEAVVQAWQNVASLAVVGAVAFIAMRWDFELYRFRAAAGAWGWELPEEVLQLPDWRKLAADENLPYSVRLAHYGAWGYLAFTVLGCFGLHYCICKIGERFTMLTDSFNDRVQGERGGDAVAFDGAQATGEFADEELRDGQDPGRAAEPLPVPVPPPEAPASGGRPRRRRAEPSIAAHDAEADRDPAAASGRGPGGPLFPPLTPPGGEETPSQRGANGNAQRSNAAVGSRRTGLYSRQTTSNKSNGVAPGRSNGRRPAAARPAQALPVIGNQPGESITLAEARKREDRYFVDPATGNIWDAAYWAALHGTPKSNGTRQERQA